MSSPLPFPRYSCKSCVHPVKSWGDSVEKHSVIWVVMIANTYFSLSSLRFCSNPPNSSIAISLISLAAVAGDSLCTISWRRPAWVTLKIRCRGLHCRKFRVKWFQKLAFHKTNHGQTCYSFLREFLTQTSNSVAAFPQSLHIATTMGGYVVNVCQKLLATLLGITLGD